MNISADSSSSSSVVATDSKNRSKDPKICSVCGDVAKSLHFGAISCDSCKAFFRRTVQAENDGNYKCPFEGNCDIKVSTRKNCQHCRFQKCLSVGMEKTWVMSDRERKEYNKQLEEKRKMKQGSQSDGMDVSLPTSTSTSNEAGPADEYVALTENIREFMTEEEENFVKNLVLKYTHSYKMIPYDKNLANDNDGRPNIQTVNMFTTIIRRFAYFAMLLPEFSSLPRPDQGMLLRAGILEMCLLRSALCFDISSNRWPNTNWELYADAPTLRLDDMKRLVTPELYEMHIAFIKSMQEMGLDEATCMLLLGITLLSPDRPGLIEKSLVSDSQDKFIHHLEKYVKWRFGPVRGQMIFPHLVTKLADLRGLSDSHNEYNLRLAKQEVKAIQESLGTLNLEGGMNPYPEYDVMTQAISPTVTSPPQMFISASQHQVSTGSEVGIVAGQSDLGTTAAEVHPVPAGGQESAMRKQFMMMIQKSMMQILNNPNLMDMDLMTSSTQTSDVITSQQEFIPSQDPIQDNFTVPVHQFVDKPILDSVRVLDDHRVRVEVHSNVHPDLSIPIGQDPSTSDHWHQQSRIQIVPQHFGASYQDPRYGHHQTPNHFSSPVQDQGAGSLSLEQLSQFKSTMEQLLRCNDAHQLDMVKRVVGSDLLQQVQTKLVHQDFSQFGGSHHSVDPNHGLLQQQQQQHQHLQQQQQQYFQYEHRVDQEEQQQQITLHDDQDLQ